MHIKTTSDLVEILGFIYFLWRKSIFVTIRVRVRVRVEIFGIDTVPGSMLQKTGSVQFQTGTRV